MSNVCKNNLGSMYERKGNYKKAKENLERISDRELRIANLKRETLDEAWF